MTDEELEKLAALIADRIKEPTAKELRPAVEAVLKITARDEQSARELAEIGEKVAMIASKLEPPPSQPQQVDLTPVMKKLAEIEERLPPPRAGPGMWNPMWWRRRAEKMPEAWRESAAWWESPVWWKRLHIAMMAVTALMWVGVAAVTGIGFWVWTTPFTHLNADAEWWLGLRLTWW